MGEFARFFKVNIDWLLTGDGPMRQNDSHPIVERFERLPTEELKTEAQWFEKEYKFVSDNGWSQVEGKGEALNRAYGQYEKVLSLISKYS